MNEVTAFFQSWSLVRTQTRAYLLRFSALNSLVGFQGEWTGSC